MDRLEVKPLLIRQLETYIREPINCLTHLLGAVLSLIGMIALLVLSWGEPLHLISFAIYGMSSILLYMASSLLHGLRVSPERRRFFLRLDHIGIFSLIAGSYTPLALITLKEQSPTFGWIFFSLVWVLAIIGMVFKLRFLDTTHFISTAFYLLLGWLAIFVLGPLAKALPADALILMITGGIFYSVGAAIFAFQRPNFYPGVFGHHELWHLFVLAGGVSHFMVFFLHVAR